MTGDFRNVDPTERLHVLSHRNLINARWLQSVCQKLVTHGCEETDTPNGKAENRPCLDVARGLIRD